MEKGHSSAVDLSSLEMHRHVETVPEDKAVDLSSVPERRLSEVKSTSVLGRFFGLGNHDETSTDSHFFGPWNHHHETSTDSATEIKFSDADRKKTSLGDLLFNRGVFAHGFEVNPDELNVLFNQK